MQSKLVILDNLSQSIIKSCYCGKKLMINLKLDITKKEMKEMSTDIIRALTQAVIVHVLTFAIDKPEGQLFGETVLVIPDSIIEVKFI